jgi:gamma-glutamylcyclotransferase
MNLHYFAYGSNMSLPRIRSRVASVQSVGVFLLPGHELLFHKRGRDGSGKCDARASASGKGVYGVVFRLANAGLENLDRVEGVGRGYLRKLVDVSADDGSVLQAFTYSATDIAEGIRPYHWYHRHVLTGAIAAGLPEDYIAELQRVEPIADHDHDRQLRELSIYESAPIS